MSKSLEILKSSAHRWVGWTALATAVALSITLLNGNSKSLYLVFNWIVSIGYWEIVFFVPMLVLLLNVACDLKLNPLVIDLCVGSSKFFLKSFYSLVGFCIVLLVANLIFGDINYAKFFAITGFTAYFISIATHWMILDLESQSNELCIESYY